MGHHLNFGLLILDHLLVQMGLIVPSESIHAQGTADILIAIPNMPSCAKAFGVR